MIGESAYNWITNFFQSDRFDPKDTRKIEYGDLNDIKYRNSRANSMKRHRINRKNVNKYRDSSPKRNGTQFPINRYSNKNKNKMNDGSWWNSLSQNLKFIFSNDTENITNMRVACEDFSLLSNNPRYANNYSNRNKIIRERMRQSRSFKKKLAERNYDKRQLEILNRSSIGRNSNSNLPISSTNNIPLNNDKILLLERQNERLRKELLQRESELRVLKKELKFLKDNNNLMNRDEILNLLSADYNTIDKIYDKENHSYDSYHRVERENDLIEERSKSFSPVQIDYSQYSR